MSQQAIQGYAEAAGLFGGFHVGDFSQVLELRFVGSVDNICDLFLTLAKKSESGTDVIELAFQQVTNLCVRDFGGGLTQILGLYIDDVRYKGWENINHEVGDCEQNKITFLAKSVCILSARSFEKN